MDVPLMALLRHQRDIHKPDQARGPLVPRAPVGEGTVTRQGTSMNVVAADPAGPLDKVS